jgi:hypothetical protein
VVSLPPTVLAAGGYGDLPLMEDYALFARMLGNGARAVNVAEPLVFYRVGSTAFRRRGGTRLLRSELRLQREFRREGFTSAPEYLRNVLLRGGYRLIPWWFRRAVYRPIAVRNASQPEPPEAGAEPPAWDYEREWDDAEMSAARCWRKPVDA